MRRKWVALVVAVMMIVVMLPTVALAAGPTVRQVFHERVQLAGRYVTIYTSTEYQTGHDNPGGTISNNRLLWLRTQGSWTFTPHENDGYDFTGWTNKTGPSGAFSESGDSLTITYKGNENYNATANFEFVGFTVTLNLGDGATFDSNGSSTITLTGVEYGTLSVPAYTVKDGYDFKGWSGSLNINSSRTLTANYEYRVNFVGNDHISITGATPVWTVNRNVTAPSYSVDAGYRFDGWDKSLNNLTGPTTITAKAAVRQYQLTLGISGEGSFWNRSAVEGTYDAGDEVRLSNALPVPGVNEIVFYYTETEIIVPTVPPIGPVSPAPTAPPAPTVPPGGGGQNEGAGQAGQAGQATLSPTETPQPTQTPQPTEIVPEETVPAAPALNPNGNNWLWLWILMGLILAGGFIFLFFLWKRRKREEEGQG